MVGSSTTLRVKLFQRGGNIWLRLPRPVAEGLEAGQVVDVSWNGDKIVIETELDKVERSSRQGSS